MLYILIDPGYANSIWCRKRLDDLTDQLKQRRTPYRIIDDVKKLTPHVFHVFLIGTDLVWVEQMVQACNSMDLRPIWLCNLSQYQVKGDYSIVCTDMMRSMKKLVAVLEGNGSRAVGLYGVNPHTTTDQGQQQGFLAALGQEAEKWIFYNDGNLEKCFQDFQQLGGAVDTLICCNNFAAVSLVRHLKKCDPQRLEHLMIVTTADTVLAEIYSEHIILFPNRSAEYGKAALSLLDTLKKMPKDTVASVSLQWDLRNLESHNSRRLTSEKTDGVSEGVSPDYFFDDSEIQQMMRLEQLLAFGSKVDHCVLKGLREGKTYSTIADENYLSLNTVKYHVKKMMNQIQIGNKKQFINLLNEYLLPQTLDRI